MRTKQICMLWSYIKGDIQNGGRPKKYLTLLNSRDVLYGYTIKAKLVTP